MCLHHHHIPIHLIVIQCQMKGCEKLLMHMQSNSSIRVIHPCEPFV